MTKKGMALIGLAGGDVQIGSYVFDPEDADKIAAFIEDSKKLRIATNANNKRTKKTDPKAS
jgi:hypothetical protein